MDFAEKDNSRTSQTVVFVDDNADVRELYRLELQQAGFHCMLSASLSELYDLIEKESIDLILLDNYLKSESGIEAIPEIIRRAPSSRVIVLTRSSSPDNIVKAIKNGAYDFIAKSTSAKEVVSKLKQVQPSFKPIPDNLKPFSGIGLVGKSKPTLDLLEDIKKVAKYDIDILISGETGTGKELVAKAIHKLSGKRSKNPMLTVNCAALTPAILESELFGVRKGAFTDAKEDRKGIFEAADQSTLFLDEIGELPQTLQSKLLRAIQEKEILPVGSTRPIKINTRIIAATNRNLKKEISLGRFREDLFYRLSVVTLYTCPLRERTDDIEELAFFFFNTMTQRYKLQHLRLLKNHINILQQYHWPGNVRELKNVIERSVLMSDRKLGLRMDSETDNTVENNVPNGPDMHLNYSDYKINCERTYLKNLMDISKGNLTEASRISGLHRPSIYRMLKRLRVKS